MKYTLVILAVLGIIVSSLALREHFREYGDAPCDAAAKPHKLPPEPMKGTATNPRVCDQLLDETRRLADEADVAVKRGGKESAEHFQRREKLTKQYEQRCVGISRAVSRP